MIMNMQQIVRDETARILVVDDDAAIRATMRAMLEDEGYHVLEAADGAQGIAALRASPTPLVTLLDLRMPVLDGEGVLRAVANESPLARRHAFVMVTANLATLPPTCATLLNRLNAPVIAKPFDLEELLDVVTKATIRLLSQIQANRDETRRLGHS